MLNKPTETYASGGSRTTYYNGGDSSILGYSENMGSGTAGTVGTSSTNIYYFKPSNNVCRNGSSRTDEFGSRSEFNQTLTDNSAGDYWNQPEQITSKKPGAKHSFRTV